jgi:hypothetical protein
MLERMRTLRILQHELRTDEIRIGRSFCQNTRSLEDIAEEVRNGYVKRGADDLSKYYSLIAIVDALSMQTSNFRLISVAVLPFPFARPEAHKSVGAFNFALNTASLFPTVSRAIIGQLPSSFSSFRLT